MPLLGFLHKKKESNTSHAAVDADSTLSTAFERMHVGASPHRRAEPQPNGPLFVGGFNVDRANHGPQQQFHYAPSHSALPPLPNPPAIGMPVPVVSRTMRYAQADVEGAPAVPPKGRCVIVVNVY